MCGALYVFLVSQGYDALFNCVESQFGLEYLVIYLLLFIWLDGADLILESKIT